VKREATKERVVKAIPRQLGEADIARRAGAVPFSLTASPDIESGAVPLPLSSSLQSLSFSTMSLVHGTFEERSAQKTSKVVDARDAQGLS